jgi:Exostosin family
MSVKLKIYTDVAFIPPGKKHTIMLYPFLGNPEKDTSDTEYGRFDDYVSKGKDIFEMVASPGEADVFVLPFEYVFDTEGMKMAERMSALAKENNKKMIVFFNSDIDKPINLPNAIIFRTSFYRSSKQANEFALPGWSADFSLSSQDAFAHPTVKSQKPAVSYCGYVDFINWTEKLNTKSVITSLMNKKNGLVNPGPILRGKAVRKLLNDNRVTANIIIRKGCWAEGMDKHTARNEYIQNILSSDYALVLRGAGNFSYRLYEVLSLGRIPVFIDSDSVLPFDEFINWKKYMVWINSSEIDSVADKLVQFHSTISVEELNRMKADCRKLYEEWICPLAFFSSIYRYV